MTNDACLSLSFVVLFIDLFFFLPVGKKFGHVSSVVTLGTVLSWIDIAAGIAAKKHGVYPAVSQHVFVHCEVWMWGGGGGAVRLHGVFVPNKKQKKRHLQRKRWIGHGIGEKKRTVRRERHRLMS